MSESPLATDQEILKWINRVVGSMEDKSLWLEVAFDIRFMYEVEHLRTPTIAELDQRITKFIQECKEYKARKKR